jgi:hypothetical protein
MDDQWKGVGWYRPADGAHYEEATGKTEWIACSGGDQYGRLFSTYQEFKFLKKVLRAKDRLW